MRSTIAARPPLRQGNKTAALRAMLAIRGFGFGVRRQTKGLALRTKFILAALALAYAAPARAEDCSPLKLIAAVDLIPAPGGVRMLVPITINGSSKQFLLNTGAGFTTLTKATVDGLHLHAVDGSRIRLLDSAGNASRSGTIKVGYQSQGPNWILSVIDNGVGMPKDIASVKPGLGTSIVQALTAQLHAVIKVGNSNPGTVVSITHTHLAVVQMASAAQADRAV